MILVNVINVSVAWSLLLGVGPLPQWAGTRCRSAPPAGTPSAG